MTICVCECVDFFFAFYVTFSLCSISFFHFSFSHSPLFVWVCVCLFWEAADSRWMLKNTVDSLCVLVHQMLSYGKKKTNMNDCVTLDSHSRSFWLQNDVNRYDAVHILISLWTIHIAISSYMYTILRGENKKWVTISQS